MGNEARKHNIRRDELKLNVSFGNNFSSRLRSYDMIIGKITGEKKKKKLIGE